MYRRKYDDIPTYLYDQLEDLYEASSHYYLDGVKNESDCFEVRRDLRQINYYTSFLEEYVHSLLELGYIREYEEVTNKLKRIKLITILPHKERIFSIRLKNDRIELNPEIDQDKNKVRIYTKFTSVLHKNWMDDISFFLEENDIEEKEDVTEGFKLLDNATSMDTADRVTALITKEELPKKNLLQVAAKDFSDTIIIDTEDSLKEMTIYSFEDDFVRKIDNKYKENLPMKKNLVKLIACLGRINVASRDTDQLRKQETSKFHYHELRNIIANNKLKR